MKEPPSVVVVMVEEALGYRIESGGRFLSRFFLLFLDFDRKTGGEKEEEYTIVVATSFLFLQEGESLLHFLFFGAPGADAALLSFLS
jgi:hypothetical protein